jgi:hypothetical protein
MAEPVPKRSPCDVDHLYDKLFPVAVAISLEAVPILTGLGVMVIFVNEKAPPGFEGALAISE